MKLLTLARDLQRRKARERHHRFVAEGVRTVESLLDSTLDVVGLLVSTSLADDERGAAVRDRALSRGYALQEVSEAEFTSAAGTDAPQGILAIASIPARAFDRPPPVARFLILDALQDPGNVGTVIRTAAALGVTATLALPGTVDLWNAKVVRSSMGAIFSHAAWMCTWSRSCHFWTNMRSCAVRPTRTVRPSSPRWTWVERTGWPWWWGTRAPVCRHQSPHGRHIAWPFA